LVAAWRSIGFAARAEAVGRADPKRYQTALHHLDENLGAIELELTKGDLSQIAKDLSGFESTSERLPEAALKIANR
jgi:hypothetical protein